MQGLVNMTLQRLCWDLGKQSLSLRPAAPPQPSLLKSSFSGVGSRDFHVSVERLPAEDV